MTPRADIVDAFCHFRFVPQGDIRACSKSRLIGSRPHLEIADRRDRGCGPAGPDGLHHFGRWFRLKDG
jgi:hypothetical protein